MTEHQGQQLQEEPLRWGNGKCRGPEAGLCHVRSKDSKELRGVVGVSFKVWLGTQNIASSVALTRNEMRNSWRVLELGECCVLT